MTRRTCARLAGAAYLVYTAAGIGHDFLIHRVMKGDGEAAKLASIAAHASEVRVAILFTLLECFSAIVLAVTLYGITRDQDHEVATLGLVCRTAEGILVATAIPELWQARRVAEGVAHGAWDPATTSALRTLVLLPGTSVPLAAIFFAVGSTAFCFLLLRGRMIPTALAWLGLLSSALLVVTVPLQLAGFSTGPVSGYTQWLPSLLFQLVLAPWLLIKGVASPTTR